MENQGERNLSIILPSENLRKVTRTLYIIEHASWVHSERLEYWNEWLRSAQQILKKTLGKGYTRAVWCVTYSKLLLKNTWQIRLDILCWHKAFRETNPSKRKTIHIFIHVYDDDFNKVNQKYWWKVWKYSACVKMIKDKSQNSTFQYCWRGIQGVEEMTGSELPQYKCV